MSQFERICNSDPHIRGLISLLYKQLNLIPDDTFPSYATKWSQDMDRTFSRDEWDSIWLATKHSSPNCLETNFKVLARWYLVPARIAKFVPSYPDTCFKGCTSPGTHYHIWWQCPIAQAFWIKIFDMASKDLEILISPDPALVLLNVKPPALTQVLILTTHKPYYYK